jgi:hypothetical protein
MLERAHVLCAIALVIAQSAATYACAKSRKQPPIHASTQTPVETGKTPSAGPPLRSLDQLAVGLKEHFSPVWTATYECRSKTADGCSAGCASASFSPIQRLTVVVGSVTIGKQDLPAYYYLAVFPSGSSKSAKSVAKAEGFIFDTKAVCGTVNMDLTFSGPGD